MKLLFLFFLIVISNVSFSQRYNGGWIDTSFVSYIGNLDSTLALERSNIRKVEFGIWGAEIKVSKHIDWVSFDKNYAVGLMQNFYEDDNNRRISGIQLVVYSKKDNTLVVFVNNNQELVGCRTYVTLVDILPFTVQCFIFGPNINNVGDLYFQFFLKDNRSSYTFRKEQEGRIFKYSKAIKQFDESKYSIYRLFRYDELISFVAKVLKISNTHRKVVGPWKEVQADSYYVSYIENLMKQRKKDLRE